MEPLSAFMQGGNPMAKTRHDHTQIVSATPGRTRLRVSTKRRNEKEMVRIASALKKKLKAPEADINVKTGSILVSHPHKSVGDLRAILQDLGVILDSATRIPMPAMGEKSVVASDIACAISDLNKRLGFTTGGLLDLRILAPLGFGTLAVLQWMRRGWQFEIVPWYVLAYAAFDSFIKLHYTRETPHGK
jgi:hypothetical protein